MPRQPPRYDVPNAAPEPLRLIQLFVNTVDLEHGREWLASPSELGAWLREHDLPAPRRLGAKDLQCAVELREALRSLLVEHNGRPADPGAVDIVNRAALAARLTVRFDPDGTAALEPQATGLDGALGHIVALVYAASAEGTFARLKACRNCDWAFYDYSRNRAARWCSMSLCGNRLKTKAYRRRRG
jgi:predicted RNA-binding Zn ribbon-like protein